MDLAINPFVLIYHLFISFLIMFYSCAIGSIKMLIPYKYRSKSIKGEIALVTGAGNGLGKQIAKKLAKLEVTVVVIDIDEKGNQATAKEINADGGKAFAFTCDLSKREDIYRTLNEIKSVVGEISILVNNAGIVTGKKFLDSSDSAIEKTMQVNTMAHFWLGKALIPSMVEKNHGHIVTIASMVGLFGVAGLSDYCASKFAAVGFDETLRNEFTSLGKTGIKTTVVCSYFIKTGMFDGVVPKLFNYLDPEYVADKVIEAILTNQEVLMMPKAMYFFYFLKGFLPIASSNYLANSGLHVNNEMDTFVGNKKQK